MVKILAIESSCDETSASVIINSEIKSNIISSQLFHSKYGGVIPELASRAHTQVVSEVVNQSLEQSGLLMQDLDAIAVTSQPGLIGSLIVGSNFAKGIAVKYNIPIIPVNHIEGHLYSGLLENPEVEFPLIALVVSGGHTAIFYVESYSKYEIIGLTRDDAAGEAFDKIAKLMGLPYPGGPLIDKYSKLGDKYKYNFPRPMIHDDHFDFSFSGLKTSVRYFIQNNFNNGLSEENIHDLSASVQAAIVDVLVNKTIKAAKKYKVKFITIAGGVSANSGLRSEMELHANKIGIKSFAPKMDYCIDNAAMIAFLAEKKYLEQNGQNYLDLTFKVSANALRAKRN